MPARSARYPPIADYAFIGDCHAAALVSRRGSIDWCCMPRMDSASVFGRMLDWRLGGYCEVSPVGRPKVSRSYLGDTLVLATTYRSGSAEARVLDCFAMRRGGALQPHRQLLRVVEGVSGRMRFSLRVAPRFDYGECRPWIRRQGDGFFAAIGGDEALLVWSDTGIAPDGKYDLVATFEVSAGERARLSVQYERPERIDSDPPTAPEPGQVDRRLRQTVRWWNAWVARGRPAGTAEPALLRSAVVLKALTNAPTGAMAAAPTTSLPEAPAGERNWDYRFSWIRDSSFAVRSLGDLGYEGEADGFRRFVERSAAGSADELQLMFGMGGERRLTEVILDDLEGYRGARPVRIGNAAQEQFQLDLYGHLVDLAWRWHERGSSPDDDYWRFLVELVESVNDRWRLPDRGIWEVRGRPRHFVHSKAMCWVALDRGVRLARETGRRAPRERWTRAAGEVRRAIEQHGYDRRRGVFVRSFGSRELDASLLLLPIVGFVAHRDERMVRTVDLVRDELDEGGLLRRYRSRDGLKGREGAFLACSFWLAECLAGQGRLEESRAVFQRALSTANDLGLFSEEFDERSNEMLGNFPQALTHLSHITAAIALRRAEALGAGS